jgi:xanthine dehydrogenase accessory factor
MALAEARRSLNQGRTSSRAVEVGGTTLVVDVVVPTTRLLVVGAGDLAAALERQAGLLDWEASSVNDGEAAAVAIKDLGPADALIVLSHDPEVDTPALGSRHTQAGRRERLMARGLSADQLGRIRGPAGLDIGARTPAEISLAIGAEILALRSGRAGTALKERAAPIND